MMEQRRFYREFQQSLEKIYPAGEAQAITDRIFESIAGINKSELIKYPDKRIESERFNMLKNALLELQTGKPIQYVLGQTFFYDLTFRVAPGVLIPRPETEELVHHLLCEMHQTSGMKILDIGTGSGCIAISIKNAFPRNEVYAIEKSADALMIAKENAEKLDATIHWHQVDFLCMQNADELPVFDIIVSNPPYIPALEIDSMEINVREFEPKMALFVPDENPLVFYQAIAQFGKTNLSEHGIIWVEIHSDFGVATQQLFDSFGYETTLLQDENGKDRFVRAVNRFR